MDFKLLFISLFLILKLTNVQATFVGNVQEKEDALGFLIQKRELELVKRLLYTGKEQRKEAKEKYEEKCERTMNVLKKPRWCPELNTWDAWNKY